MVKRLAVLLAVASTMAGCAHSQVSNSTLNRVHSPAFISRIEDGAGPRANVFRDDGSYGGKLKKLEPKEADRRLTVKLGKGITRFELSESLRAKVAALLPPVSPWSQALDPARVATALESFLVEEVPANAPDYDLLKPLGADAVVEFVIESYGMRSKGGKAGPFVEGYGRMFFLDGGGDVWRRSFSADALDNGSPHLDPFLVAKEPVRFRTELTALIDGVAAQFAKDLNPPDRAPPSGDDSPRPERKNEAEQELPPPTPNDDPL